MKKIESFCVSCGLPCLGRACPNHSGTVYYCDECGDYAKYQIENNDYCESCAKEYIQEAFDDLTMSEKAELLDISLHEYD